jgi:hypothetical protein
MLNSTIDCGYRLVPGAALAFEEDLVPRTALRAQGALLAGSQCFI